MRAQRTDKSWLACLSVVALLVPGAHAACTFSTSPASRSHGDGMTNNSFGVVADPGCAWSVLNTNPWITILSGSSGTGPGTVSYSVAANPNPVERTGLVFIATNTFTIRQDAVDCEFSLSPATRTHGPGENASSTTLNAGGSGCTWSIVNPNSWITIQGAPNGSGGIIVNYTFTANPSPFWRTGLVTIANQTYTVLQRGITCDYDLTPTKANHGHGGTASNGFSVAAVAGCNWTVTNTSSWITIITPANGSGNGIVGYSVAPNPTGQARTGIVMVANAAFTLGQSGQSCTYSILPTSAAHGVEAEIGTINVMALTGCPWSAAPSNAWIQITSGGTGVGNGIVGYSVGANPGPGPRTGYLSIEGQLFSITQPAPACYYRLSPTNRVHGRSATFNSFTIAAPLGCAWTLVNTSSWIHLQSPSSGAGSNTINYTVDANTVVAERSAALIVGGQALTLTQLGISCGINLLPGDRSHGHGFASNGFSVTLAIPGCNWASSTTNSWVHITSGTNGTDSGTVTYTVDPNPSGLARAGAISVADELFLITQDGAPCSWSIAPSGRTHGHGLTNNTVTVTATPDCPWSAVSTNSWITIVSGANGAGDGTVAYVINPNPTSAPRSGNLLIAGSVFPITQSGAPCNFSIQPAEGLHGFHLETGIVSVTGIFGCPWTVSNTNNWVAITSGAGGGTQSGTVGYVLASNPGATPRIGYVTIAGQTFTVSQGAVSCSYRVSPAMRNHGYAAAGNSISLVASNGCGWTVVNTSSWINIVPPLTGGGSANIGYTVAVNPLTISRTAVVVVGGQPVTINQDGTNCNIGVSPAGRSHGPGMNGNTVSVTDASSCGWSLINTNGWLSFGAATGVGTSNIAYTVAGNTAAVERVAIVSIAGETFNVTQQAASCSITLSPDSRMHGPGMAENTLVVMDNWGCGWSIINTNGWLSFASSTGSGLTPVGYSVALNPSTSERVGYVIVSSPTMAQSMVITQQPSTCMLSLSPSGRAHGYGATNNTILVTDTANCGWSVIKTSSWVTITTPLSGVGNSHVDYVVEGNQSLNPRSTVILVSDAAYTLTQAGYECDYRISPVNRTNGFLAVTNTFIVNTTPNCPWSIVNTNPWVTLLTNASGIGSNVVTYAITPNLTTNLRFGVIVAGNAALNLAQRGATNGLGFQVTTIQDGSQLRVRLVGVPTGKWELQGSADMQSWTKIADLTNVVGAVEYIDPTPATLHHRFYRAIFR